MKSNLATHVINIEHGFMEINNTFLKHTRKSYKGNAINF